MKSVLHLLCPSLCFLPAKVEWVRHRWLARDRIICMPQPQQSPRCQTVRTWRRSPLRCSGGRPGARAVATAVVLARKVGHKALRGRAARGWPRSIDCCRRLYPPTPDQSHLSRGHSGKLHKPPHTHHHLRVYLRVFLHVFRFAGTHV